MRPWLPILTAQLLLGVLAAQGRTWTVRAPNSIDSVLAQAADGDLVIVTPGNYSPFTLRKGLIIAFAPGAKIFDITQFVCVVTGIGPGRHAAIEGIATDPSVFGFCSLAIRNNQGRVTIDRAVLRGGAGSPAVVIDSSAQVHLQLCQVTGPGGMSVTDSNVTVSSCAFTSIAGAGRVPGVPGLSATRSTLDLSQTTLISAGGIGSTYGASIANSSVRLCGETTLVQAGVGSLNSPAAAIEATLSDITIDPNVRLLPAWGAAPISGGTVDSRPLASLSVTNGPPGTTKSADLSSPSGDVVVLLSGLAGPPASFPGIGTFWLDPGAHYVAALGLQGASGHFTVQLPVPANPSLSFVPWMMQGASGTASRVQLSNPVAYVLQ